MNSYVEKIISVVENWKDMNQVNSYISNLNISNNSKRMYMYHFKKHCESLNISTNGLDHYTQEFKTKKRDLTFDEVQEVKKFIDCDKINFIFNALLETGVRIEEFVSIDWQNQKDETICVKTAKNKDQYRFAFISEQTLNILKNLQYRNFSFLSLTIKNIQYELAKLGKLANLSIPLSPHVLRRTKGSLLRLNGAKIEDIADVLGHKNMETTRKYYSRLNEQHLKAISSLSEMKPSESIEWQALKHENDLLKKKIILLEQELQNERAKKSN